MKRLLQALIILAVILSFSACSAAEEAAPSPSPALTASALTTPSPSPSPPLPDGYIPDASDNGGYIANSGCDLYEDEDYLVLKDDNGIYVYSKSRSKIADVLPRCTAFTYYNGKVYYTGYDAENKKRYITEYVPATGTERRIKDMDNSIISMLCFDGRLYYSYRTDQEDITSTELRSIDLNGGDMRTAGAQGVEDFCIAGNIIYYIKVDSYRNKAGPSVRRLNTVTGDDEQITPETSYPNIFEIKGDSLYFCDDNEEYIGELNLATGKINPTDAVVGWGSDFAPLGQYIVYIDKGDLYETPAELYACDKDTNISYDLAELEFTFYGIHATEFGAYICPYDDFGSCRLYRLRIQDGKAFLEEVFNYDPIKQVSSDIVIMAGGWGDIYGGYAEGRWITPTDAAQYCRQEVTFNEYNLTGLVDTVRSSGADYDYYSDGAASSAIDMDPEVYDWDSFYRLDIPESEHDHEKPEYPLNGTYLYTAEPGRLPDMEVITDVSDLLPKVQKLLDENFGKGKVKANIGIAVSADIDNDGDKEIIVNADNNFMQRNMPWDDYDKTADWYSLACIIESDGTISVIAGYYEDCVPEESEYVYVQNIIDLDGDGMYEIVVDDTGFEWYYTVVFKYDGNELTVVLNHSYGS